MRLTLEDLGRLHGEKRVREFFERQHPQSHDSFLENINSCLDRAVGEAQRAAQYLFEASEDYITTFIVSNLRAQLLDAEHDSDSGGHVDIFIEDADKRFHWAAEAKIDTDWPWIEGGIGQLMDRYVDGTNGKDNGGFLIYIKNSEASKRMGEWRSRVKNKYSTKPGYQDFDCPAKSPYAFYSECEYHKTGQLFRIRHVAVVLFRQASKDAAEAKALEAAKIKAKLAFVAQASTEAAQASAAAKKALKELADAHPGDNKIFAAAELVRSATEKIEQAAEVMAKGVPAKRVRGGKPPKK